MDNAQKNQLFERKLLIDRDAAIAFMKRVGFVETPEASVFMRDSERSALQKEAGARALTIVNVDALIAVPKAWRQFVQRWGRKLAARPQQ